MYSAKLSYITVIILALISTGHCIECNVCSSRTNPECSDISVENSTFLQVCENPHAFCRKTIQSLAQNSDIIIARDCGWIKFDKHDGDYCMVSNSNFKKEISCQCFTDGCNGSETFMLSRVLVSVIVFVTICLSGY